MYDKLREWFDTFDADPFTMAVVGALVDVAETARCIDGMVGEPLGAELAQAIGDLEEALGDTEAVAA